MTLRHTKRHGVLSSDVCLAELEAFLRQLLCRLREASRLGVLHHDERSLLVHSHWDDSAVHADGSCLLRGVGARGGSPVYMARE